MPIKPVLFGCEGPVLLAEEGTLFASAQPFGFILFKRNCENPDQVRVLVKELRASVGRDDAPVFIDQEGGSVARLKPPHWKELPALRRIGELYEKDRGAGEEAAMLHARITAAMLTDIGIDGNFAPVVDLFIAGATSAIGDRAISADPLVVASVAHVLMNTYLDHGVMPVIKHMPGHGRAGVDPHLTLPTVETPYAILAKEDFEPFKRLRHAPCAMNCHVVFKALDDTLPVSLSRKAHDEFLRGIIGFDGVIFSDDLAMKALSGSRDKLALQALQAGADFVLYCPGLRPEMSQIAAALPPVPTLTMRRWQKAVAQKRAGKTVDQDKDLARLTELFART